MKRCLLVLFIVSICFGKDLFIETSLENRYSPDFAGKYGTVLQGPNISVNKLFGNSFVAGIGLGPMLMNGYVPSNDSMSAMMQGATSIWADIYYVINFHWANALLCLGGKIGLISDNYNLVYDINGELVDVIPNYSVLDTYYSSIGPKFMIGFRHFRFVANGFMNFGQRKETYVQPYNGEIQGTKTSSISSFQFDIGIVIVLGND
jgi:hypothetical protein